MNPGDSKKLIPIACTLEPGAIPDRLAEWAALRADALLGTEDIDGGVRLRFATGATEAVRSLVAAEARCCAFLTFEERVAGDAFVIDVIAPAGAESVPRMLAGCA